MRTALSAALFSLAGPALASDFFLSQPIDCTLGDTCYIQQYVDHDPGPGARDFKCSGLSYDGHKGTDFALPTLKALTPGVDVLAAAPGTVRGVRDGMKDQLFTRANAAEVEGRECGNGVVIYHEGGWETQYCHLREGSIRVQTGDTVRRGSVLGQVGLSGRTQFPHLHLSVRHIGKVVDPFDPDGALACDGGTQDTLWQTPPPYRPTAVLEVGLASAVPEYDAVKAGTAGQDTLPPDADALVVYGFAFGGRKGDVMELALTGPEGEIVTRSVTLDRNQAQFFRATGKRLRTASWATGDYTGAVRLIRDGKVLHSKSTRVPIQ